MEKKKSQQTPLTENTNSVSVHTPTYTTAYTPTSTPTSTTASSTASTPLPTPVNTYILCLRNQSSDLVICHLPIQNTN